MSASGTVRAGAGDEPRSGDVSPEEETLFLETSLGRHDAYHLRFELEVRGAPADAVLRACEALVRRHPRLRSVFQDTGTGVRRLVLPPERIPVILADRPRPASALTSIAVTESPTAVLVRIATHHLVCDGTSKSIIAQDLADLLGSSLSGEADLTPATVDESLVAEAVEYWRARPSTPLEPAGRRPGTASARKRHTSATVPGARRRELVEVAKSARCSLLNVVLSVLSAALGRFGSDDPVIGLAVDNRGPDELGVVAGVSTVVPVRPVAAGAPTLADAAARTGTALREQLRFRRVPVRRLLTGQAFPHAAQTSSLLRFMVSYQRMRSVYVSGGIEVRMRDTATTSGVAGELTLHVFDDGDELRWRLEADDAIYDHDASQALLAHLVGALDAWLDAPHGPYPAPEPAPSVAFGPVTSYPRDRTVPALLAEAVARHEHRVAVTDQGTDHTYAELWRDCRAMASGLEAAGVRAGDTVAIIARRSYRTITAMAAVLVTGAQYLPLDPALAEPALTRQLALAKVRLVLSDGERPPGAGQRYLSLDAVDVPSGAATMAESGPLAPAYTMFTSGSTGAPKGVVAHHRGIVRLCRDNGYLAPSTDDVFLSHSPLSFDASTFEIWTALLNGARVAVAPPHQMSLAELAEAIRRERTTVLFVTSAIFGLLAENHAGDLIGLRTIITGGDVVPAGPLHSLRRRLPRTRVVAAYGPTEATTYSTTFRVTDDDGTDDIPIGLSIANGSTYVLDEDLRPVPRGRVGELYLGGDGVALGYQGDPALTAQRFLPDPFAAPGERMYRTGDLVRMEAGGVIRFLGRVDREVKIRGRRINLGDTEGLLRRAPGVLDAAAFTIGEEPYRRLAAAVRLDVSTTLEEVRAWCATASQDPHVPDRLSSVEEIPLTEHGKTDYARLRGFATVEQARETAPAVSSPARQTLRELWRELLGTEPAEDADLIKHGGNSLTLLRLLAGLKKTLGVKLSLGAVYREPTFESIARLIEGHDREASR